MATFTNEVNRINGQLYDGLAEYNKTLRQSLTTTTTITNPLGKTCNITFGSFNMNFNFFNLPFQKTPLNFNLFNKFEKASNIASDVNSTFIKMIEDLECCDLAKNYNNNILPLFMWFIGDSGNSYSHPDQYDSSRKSSGFLPILIEVAEGLMKAYEPVKALTCIVRPVPGNPWMKAGGTDFLKPIYNVVSELDFVMKTLLNGEYLDIIIEPMKHFRDQVTQCNGKNRNKLQLVDASNLMTEDAIHLRDSINNMLENHATEIKLNSTKYPVHSDLYFKLQAQIASFTNDTITWKTQITQNDTKIATIRLDIEDKTTLLDSAKQEKLNLTEAFNYLDNTSPLYNSTLVEIDNITTKIKNLENIIDGYDSDIQDLIKLNDEITIKADVSSLTKLQEERDVEEELFQQQLKLYNQYLIFQQTTLDKFKNCTLITKALAGARTENSCNCLLSLLNIFVPIPEIVQITSDAEIDSKLVGRLPFSESMKYIQNDYTLISRSNLVDKFKGVPTFLYPGNAWRNNITGVSPITQMTPTKKASDFYADMDNAQTLLEAIQVGNTLLTNRQLTSNNKLKIDTELNNLLTSIIEQIQALKISKMKELIQISSINEANASTFFKDYTSQLYTVDESGNTIYSLNVAKRVQLKKDLVIIDDLLSFPTVTYLIENIPLIPSNFEIMPSTILELSNLDKQSTDLDKNISDWDALIKLNTRVVTILSKDNIPCDCNIICRLIQYIVDTIMGAIKAIFNRLVDMILNSIMTKEMAYILRFVRAKLQCLIDILAIPDNINIISERAKNLIDEMQMKLQYAMEPSFCLNTPGTSTTGNSIIPVNTNTTSDIQKPLIKYNIDGPGSGEQYYNNNGIDSTTTGAYPYPNTSGTVYPIDTTTINNNKLIIKNVIPGQQYEFRNIPTLFFDCNIPDPSLRPVFDIVTDQAPTIWSCYFSFSLTSEKLNNFANKIVFEPLTTNEQNVKTLVMQELNTDITPSLNIWNDIDVQSVIDAAKIAATTTIPDQFKKKVEECTPETVLVETGESTCGYHHLELVSIELLNPLVNNANFNFVQETAGISINLKEDISRFNIPIKVKVKKILEDPSKHLVFNEYNPEQVSVILLLDFYSSTDTVDALKGTYDRKPIFDINLFYGRYPYLEIGYREYGLGGIYHLPGNIITNYLDFDTLLNLCDKALVSKKTVDATQYQPTPEQIAKRSELIQDRWKQNPCYLPTEARDAIENNKEVIDNIVKPLLMDFAEKLNTKTEWIITQTPIIDNAAIQQITNATQKTVEYGIPLLELDRVKNICVQIIQVKTIENGIDVYKPMVNISNFNFLSDILNITDNNNIPMIIKPNQVYFMSITFDGSKYQFTLIDENKVQARLTKLKTTSNSLFPTRFGRMTDQELIDQTFCGTLFDLGIANTVISPELYYKFSMLNFNPHSDIFIDFETNLNNNFYSSSDLPTTQLSSAKLTPEVRSYLEQTYLKNYGQSSIPYYIYNKYISAQPMNHSIVVEGNKFKNALKESYLTNFFCQESIKNKSFTLSFWFKRISNEFINITPSRMMLVSDTKFFNNFYYDDETVEFVMELNNKSQIIRIPKFLQVGVWNNIIMKFDHLLNRMNIYITNENENEIHQIYVGTLNHQFDFNLISLLTEFDFNLKKFTNFFPCLIGNLIVDSNIISDSILNESFPLQKLAFKGL